MSSDYHSTESGVGVRNLPSVKTPRNGLSRRHCCFGAEDAPAWRPGSHADGGGAVRAELLSREMLLDSSVLLSFFLKFRFPPLTFGHVERSFGSSQGQTSFPRSPLSGAAEPRASHTEGKTLPAERLRPAVLPWPGAGARIPPRCAFSAILDIWRRLSACGAFRVDGAAATSRFGGVGNVTSLLSRWRGVCDRHPSPHRVAPVWQATAQSPGGGPVL